MLVQLQIELPESVFSALRSSPEEFLHEMRIAASIKWYELERISQAKAAEIAGVSRQEYINLLSRFNVPPFQETPDDLVKEFGDV